MDLFKKSRYNAIAIVNYDILKILRISEKGLIEILVSASAKWKSL
jgi:hypothetical protein